MFGRIVSALAGRSLARSAGRGGVTGLIVGAALPTVLRRLGPGGIVAAAVGSWAMRKAMARREAAQADIQPASKPKAR